MSANSTIGPGLLRRYDRPGPRYTSYPTAQQFSSTASPCFYCGCTRIITRDRSRADTYDFDPHVQEAVNRVRTVEETVAIVEACRRVGMRSVSIDLIYGPPRQTPERFGATLDTVIAANPDRLAIYSYAHLPDLFKLQWRIGVAELPPPEMKIALLELVVLKLESAGYVYIGMDHFALPNDELTQARAAGTPHRNFMGYTTHADTDLMRVGVSAISHIGATYSQNPRDLASWQAAIDDARHPVCRGLHLSMDDRIRADLIRRLMCHGEIPMSVLECRYAIVFDDYFHDDLVRLQPLVDDGLVRIQAGRIVATSQGRLLLRNIAMCFDRHLMTAGSPVKFSRGI
jgi:oxygen-independent coproporphyrinogen-3 oxidase